MYSLDNKNCHSRNTYNEIFQSLTMKFAFALIDEKREVIAPIYKPAKCREYLGDVIWSMESKKKSNIYSFLFDPEVTPIYKGKTILYVEYPNKISKDFAIENIHTMNHYEYALGFDPSLIVEINTKSADAALAYIGDKMWQQKSFAISYYSLLIKGMARKLEEGTDWRKEICKQESNETSLLKSIPSFEIIDNMLYKLIKTNGSSTGYENHYYDNIHMTHGQSGFHAIFRTRIRSPNPNAYQGDSDYGNIYVKEVQRAYKKANTGNDQQQHENAENAG